METVLLYLLPFALAAVVIVLLLGLLNMARGGDAKRSQNLMRLRVQFQFVAIAIVLLIMWAASR